MHNTIQLLLTVRTDDSDPHGTDLKDALRKQAERGEDAYMEIGDIGVDVANIELIIPL